MPRGEKTKELWKNPEYRKHMSEVHMGHPKPENAYSFPVGHKINKGKVRSAEDRKKKAESQKGKKSHLWKGGLTPINKRIRNSVDFRLWREAVYARDNFTCQKCGDDRGKNLNPHHIFNFADYPELRFAIDNGITLCDKCHTRFHKIYGKKNNTKEQLEEFFQNK